MKNLGMIGSLTSFRFFAALAIVVHHCNGILINDLGLLSDVPLSSGVGFFFVLSGFILSHAYLDSGKNVSPIRFYVYRLSRVWPAHVFTLLMVMVLMPSAAWVSAPVDMAAGILSNFFMIHSIIPFPGYYFSLNWVSWSISTEVFFYLMFPVALVVVKGGKLSSWMGFLSATMLGFLVALICDRLGVAYYPADASQLSSHGLSYISPVGRIQEFFIGIAAFQLSKNISLSALNGVKSHSVVEVLSVVMICLLLPVVFYSVRGYGYYLGEASAEYLSHYVVALMFAAFIIVFSKSAGVVTSLLSWRPMILIGEISFSLYLTHQVLLRYYQLHQDQFVFIPHELKFSVLLLTSLAASYLIFKFIELPSQRAIRKRYADFINRRNANRSIPVDI